MLNSFSEKRTRDRMMAGSIRCRFSSNQMQLLQCICGTDRVTRVMPSSLYSTNLSRTSAISKSSGRSSVVSRSSFTPGLSASS